jgi:4-alpha-glucanotransferase
MSTSKKNPIDGGAAMAADRASGLLLHITSLPGKYGGGSLGREALAFGDFLAASGQTYWQVLPLGPVCAHWNFSPYSSPSAFAGNEWLIDPQDMCDRGWLTVEQLRACEMDPNADFTDLAATAASRADLLQKAFRAFALQQDSEEHAAFQRFCDAQRPWLDDYALFRSLADHFKTFQWLNWPEDIARRLPAALAGWGAKLAVAVDLWKFAQFVFFRQFTEFRRCIGQKGLRLIGDIPFYVNFESADAWSHPEIFQLEGDRRLPAAVAGVPPDYFSQSGQRWGNPLYEWGAAGQAVRPATMDWWTARIGHLLELVDILRIDHFRGFESYWAIPARDSTAINGRWQPGPGAAFFNALKSRLGDLPLIAEDLGEITPAVDALRDALGLPGMKILQFAFDGHPDNPYLPHNFRTPNCLVYTGTHDNNTSNGWFYGDESSAATKQYVLDYLNVAHRDEFHWQFIRLAMQSIARLAVFPVQDVLGFDGRFRMNTPGRGTGNWAWKLREGALTPEIGQRLRRLTALYNRLPRP